MGFFRRKADTRRAGIALDKYFLVTCGVNQAPRTPSFLASYQQGHDSSNSRERGEQKTYLDLRPGGEWQRKALAMLGKKQSNGPADPCIGGSTSHLNALPNDGCSR
jgi:hypothetical protein